MSLKDLFKEGKLKYISNESLSSLTASGVESPEYIEAFLEESKRFIPLIDYSNPENFARFGSAEKYYYDSITNIYNTYPYDGSRKEKVLWELSSSGLDLYLFENGYPRTTGYAIFSTASLTATDVSTDYAVWGSYGAAGSGTYEYIGFSGGPHAGEGTSIYVDPDTGESHFRKDANIYDLSENRECNLKIDGNDGNTVEFWLKKAAFDPAATQTEVLFDIFTTSSISSSLNYGRLTVEMSGHGVGTNTLSPFYVTYMSGTAGISKENIGASLTTASIADDSWHHYSFRFKNDGSNTSVDLFVDGEYNHNIKTGTTVDYVSGTIVGTIGALATNPSGSAAGAPQAAKGWGKLSGSMDEFRFWKVWRTARQIQTRWFDQVGGGTNTDDANTHLGLYYKFNEGITATASTDINVLDYSGRVSNGTWVGYSTSFSRDTGSAINDSGLTTYFATEFEDPILYSFHPDVASFLSSKRKEGRERDYDNPSVIYYSMPAWILDEHDGDNTDAENIARNSLWNLTQIISSYFDNATNMMKSMPSLAQNDYFSGSQKPVPFMKNILESKGFFTPEIFNALDSLEEFENRDNNSKYTEKIENIKNIIYKNIYNNLTYINKSKGTEKSFRNLIRCFGLDEKLYKLNIYSNNVTYVLEDNHSTVSDTFRLVNFNTIENSDATVYQYSSSTNANTTTFISASNDTAIATSPEYGMPFTVEANIIFPSRVTQGDYSTFRHGYNSEINNYPLIETASIFGMHTADDSNPSDTAWATNDYANFVVKAIKPETYTKRARFVLTGTAGGFLPELSSSYYDVYDDLSWNFLVSLYSSDYPNNDQVSGTAESDVDYIVEFSGIQKNVDSVINSFTVTGTISAEEAAKFLASPKRVFAGAHRTNFTGSLIERADHKFNSIRVWQNKLSTDDLSVHASDPNNYSIKDPAKNAYLFNTSINGVYVPNKETLLLHWDFTNVTGSDASGEFIVEDLTSGSSDQISRYGFLSNLVDKQFTGKGYEFSQSSTDVVVYDDIVVAKPSIPEVLSNENTIKVLQNDDIYYTRDSRPTFFDLYVEKSPYQNISEEMLKFMSTVIDFNNLIGHGVDRYRGEYKALKTLKQLFFQRMDTPDIDKYVEYFKWFDLAVSSMIQKLAPMSSGLDERPLRNIIESHILERNKYQSKFPTYEFKQSDPEASLFGINELTYPWKEGHAPLSEDESDNCLWFKDRAERDGIPTSGDSDVDSDRQEIIDVINNQSNTTAPNLSGSSGTYQGSTYALRRFPRPYKINAVKQPEIHGGGNAHENKKVGFWDSLRKRPTPDGGNEGGLISIEPPDTDLDMFKDCDDNLELNKGKRKYNFSAGTTQDDISDFAEIYKGDLVFPFSLYSSSVDSNPAMADLEDFQSNLAITNLHHDSYGPFSDVPMQGPFTEKFVGGRPYRHVMTNFTWDNEQPDSEGERLEGWRLTASADALDLVNPDAPRSVYFREEYAKRPVNIKNIKQLTSSLYDADDQATDAFGVTRIGNYTNTYEIVMTNGRSINNRYLAESDGDLAATTSDSVYVSGVVDFPLPRRDLTGSSKAIIVNRFSAPGDAATMGEGMLDIAAGEYSVYNALPFRNLSVRMPLDELYSDHTNQFGFFSDARTVADYERADWADYPGGSSSIDDLDADLDYRGTGSFHKINRNGRKQPKYSNEYTGDLGTISTSASYDNWFVQHQIPQTDVQYAWITASLIENYTGSALYGFEQPDFSNASLASTDLTFITSSDFVGFNPPPNRIFGADGKISGLTNVMPGDFAGLNTLVYEPVSSSTNILGYPAGTSLGDATTTVLQYRNVDVFPATAIQLVAPGAANILLLKRQGPYGGANWKLYRKDNHPIVRTHRSENRLSFTEEIIVNNPDGLPIISNGNKGSITSVIEPPITSKYKQLTHRVIDRASNEEVDINHTYMNNIRFFTDHVADGIDLDGKLLDPKKNTKTEQEMLDVLNYYIYEASDFEGVEGFNPISGLVKLTTRETIFPKEQYTYLSSHRQREDYENGFWRDSADDRRELGSIGQDGKNSARNPFNFIPGRDFTTRIFDIPLISPENYTGSIWSMDSRQDFQTNSPGRIKSGSDEGLSTYSSRDYRPQISASDGSGILQNSYYPYSCYVFASATTFTPPDEFLSVYSTLLPQYNRRIAGVIPSDTTHEYKLGDTKWETGEQSGKAPFYDTYDDYIDDIKRVGKDYALIPEFRISNHMDFYLNEAENGFLTRPDNVYEITGTTLQDSSNSEFGKTYSHTDFLKTFSIVDDFYGSETTPTKVTLSAEALIKFLPYDGFYPADRTVQLAAEFWDSYKSSFAITGSVRNYGGTAGDATEYELGEEISNEEAAIINPVWKAFFAPGILYNSIKSGIAVDYPVHLTGTYLNPEGEPNQYKTNSSGYRYLSDIPRIDDDFDYRVPFEALVDPEASHDKGIGGKFVIDSEPHPSASTDITASLGSPGKLNYKLAMHNFLASTVDFFKPDGKLTTIASYADTDTKFGSQFDSNLKSFGFEVGKEYKMRLACFNSSITTQKGYSDLFQDPANPLINLYSSSFDVNPANCQMYAQTGSITSGERTADYYGSAFGPPVANNTALKSDFSPTPLYGSASYEPFTPPYYDGLSYIEYTFAPENEDEFASLHDIMNNTTQTYVRYSTGFYAPLASADIPLRNKMHLSSSLNVTLVNKPSTVFDALGNPLEVRDEASNAGTVLTIQPKWETPILNFKDVDVTLPDIGSGSVARGMWHQYGRKPVGQEGIWLQVQDLDPAEMSDPTLTGSLAKQLGLKTEPVRLGQVAEEKKISEAIVAIPFFTDTNGNVKRFSIDRKVIEVAESIADKKQSGLEQTQNEIQPDISITDMVTKMKKFVFPPHLDFVTNKDLQPFAMFVFDFEVSLTEKDLTDIWQNLSPDIGTSFKKTKATLPVDIFLPLEQPPTANQVVGTRFSMLKTLPENTRWQVFKVKQRSEKSYFAKTADSSDDSRFKFNFEFGSAGAEIESVPDYSYNWPYDFFSLIELAKIDADIESVPNESLASLHEGQIAVNHILGLPDMEGGQGLLNQMPVLEDNIPVDLLQQIASGDATQQAPDGSPVEGPEGGLGELAKSVNNLLNPGEF